MRLTPLESVLNRNIAGAATARKLCKQLEGKVLEHLQLEHPFLPSESLLK